jgi:conserved hypothetical protein
MFARIWLTYICLVVLIPIKGTDMNQMQVKNEAANIQSVKLDYPIRIHTANGEKLLESLPVRRLTVGDLRAVAGLKTDAEQELAMMARITGLVPEDLDLLDLADYQKLQLFFRNSAGGTGGTE